MKKIAVTIGFFTLLFIITYLFVNIVKLIFLHIGTVAIALILDLFIFMGIVIFIEVIVRYTKNIFRNDKDLLK